MEMIPIQDSEDERVQYFRMLKGNDPRLERRGCILVEGDQQVERLLRTDLPLDTLFMEEQFYDRFSPYLTPQRLGDAVCFTASRDVMAEIVGYRLHRGVMVLAARPPKVSLSQLTGPIVALNALNDPENVGAIMRTCAAFGVRSLLVDGACSDPYHRRSIRVSMSAALSMAVCVEPALPGAVTALAQSRRVVGVELAPHAVPAASFRFADDVVLVLGNERTGLEPEVIACCHSLLEIPMDRCVVSSLNVSAAAAVVLSRVFEALHPSS